MCTAVPGDVASDGVAVAPVRSERVENGTSPSRTAAAPADHRQPEGPGGLAAGAAARSRAYGLLRQVRADPSLERRPTFERDDERVARLGPGMPDGVLQ